MYEQIAANKRRTAVLVLGFVVLLVAVGAAINLLLAGGWIGLVVVVVIVAVSSFVSYRNSDRVALSLSRAVPADPVEYARFHNLVEGLCIASGMPKPRLFVVVDDAPNAFATGRDPKHAAIAVTTGLLATMNRVELEGVLAHELSHIRNYDILVMTIAVTMVGITAVVSDVLLRFMFWGGRGRSDDGGSNNPAAAILAVFGLLLLVFAPIIATLMKYAVSRNREYLADASGVQMTRYPPGLIAALEKLRDDRTVVRTSSKATAHLWIEEPLEVDDERGPNRLNHLFATHPPIEDRIRALREM